jgi:hypothetical protein
MSQHSQHAYRDTRPEFMKTLGLAPPYVLDDVEQAYREMVKKVHPDKGGTTAAFNEVHQAYEQAREYVEFRTDRRAWIAASMSRYVALQEAMEHLRPLGAMVTTSARPWVERSFGDFAQLTETASQIVARDLAQGDRVIDVIVREHVALRELESLDLAGSQVSDDAVLRLGVFQQLKRLNLSRTPITAKALEVVDRIPSLVELDIDETSIGWWAKHRLRSRLAKREKG